MLTLIAVGAGVVLGAITGPLLALRRQPSTLGRLGHWSLLVFGIGLSLVAGYLLHGAVALVSAVVGYVALIAFCVLNRHLAGLLVVAAGLLLNAFVVTVDGGMPVHAAAIRSAVPARIHPAAGPIEGRHHLETKGDVLTFLDDRVPAPAFHQVLSIGDIVLLVGIGAVLMALTPISVPIGPRRRSWVRPRPLRAKSRRGGGQFSGV